MSCKNAWFKNLLRFTTQRVDVIIRHSAANRTSLSSLTLRFFLWRHLWDVLEDNDSSDLANHSWSVHHSYDVINSLPFSWRLFFGIAHQSCLSLLQPLVHICCIWYALVPYSLVYFHLHPQIPSRDLQSYHLAQRTMHFWFWYCCWLWGRGALGVWSCVIPLQ